MTNRILRIPFAAALLAALAGCGNKGALVHPTPTPADEMPVPATTGTSLPTPAGTAPATPTGTTTPPDDATSPPPPPPGGG